LTTAWIGFQDQDDDGTFTWINRDPVTFSRYGMFSFSDNL